MSEQPYPDVFGILSDKRITVDGVVQCALGVFPPQTALGKPVEVLLLLQNLTDQKLQLQLTTKTPTRDSAGNLINLFTPKPRLGMALPPAECGLVHLPLTPQLPTPPGKNYPVLVHVGVQKPDMFRTVRSEYGGPQPSVLAISPSRVTVLREIEFSARTREPNQLGVVFDVLAGSFPPPDDEPMPRYEALWTLNDLEQEQARIKEKAGEALQFARSQDRNILFPVMMEFTRDMFSDAGVPLHDGEARFVTKALIYVMEDGLDLEQGFSLAEGYWFQRLCWFMANQPEVVESLDDLLPRIYSAVVHDAVLVGFYMVGYDTGADFGDQNEQRDYAAKVVAGLEGRASLGLEHVFVPLLMAGTLLNPRLTTYSENPWRSLDQLKEAKNGRVNQVGSTFDEVFDILDTLIEKTERMMREMHIPRD